jgi:hypothetical protein
VWLPWQWAAWLSAVLAVVSTAMHLRTPPARWVWLRELSREAAIFSILYATWQYIGKLSTGDTDHAVARGQEIVRLQHLLRFPSEQSVQHLALHSHVIIVLANWYYVVGHAPVMGVFLVWLYVRHRRDFARWRTVLAIGCIFGELIQIVPVAPPRLTLDGIVDTARVYGPQVYSSDGAGFAPQLAAMPSLHCVWAITTGVAIFVVARSRWRWVGPVHAAATVLAVVITGNHYWLDALAGGAMVLLGLGMHDGAALLRRRSRRPVSPAPADESGSDQRPSTEPPDRPARQPADAVAD